MGSDFSIPYYIVDSDSIVDDATEFWFYVPPSYTLNYDAASRASFYAASPFNDQKYFLVSCGNTSYQGVAAEVVPEQDSSRAMNARATWVYDTAMYNLVGTGRRWMGELFDFTTTRVYDFRERTAMTASTVNQPVPGTAVHVQIKAVARSSTNNTKLLVQYG